MQGPTNHGFPGPWKTGRTGTRNSGLPRTERNHRERLKKPRIRTLTQKRRSSTYLQLDLQGAFVCVSACLQYPELFFMWNAFWNFVQYDQLSTKLKETCWFALKTSFYFKSLSCKCFRTEGSVRGVWFSWRHEVSIQWENCFQNGPEDQSRKYGGLSESGSPKSVATFKF